MRAREGSASRAPAPMTDKTARDLVKAVQLLADATAELTFVTRGLTQVLIDDREAEAKEAEGAQDQADDNPHGYL
jgi:hypothetical protein